MSSFVLKIIACVSMFIDHLSYIIPGNPMFMGYIGRLAFPIFAFQLSEGYTHTKNLKKYLIKLFIFGLIAQIPYKLYFATDTLNIMFTLLVGILAIHICNLLKSKLGTSANFINICIIAAIAYLAEIFKLDYGFYGIIIICIFYFFRNNKLLTSILFVLSTALFFIFKYAIYDVNYIIVFLLFFFTSLGIVPCLLYNKKQGIKMKYFLYIFYPAHLLIFYFIKLLLPL